MDRTEASDAFNAGSIPVGCIFITIQKQERKVLNMALNDKKNKKKKIYDIKYKAGLNFGNIFSTMKAFSMKHWKIVVSAVVGVFAVIVIIVAVLNMAKTNKTQTDVPESIVVDETVAGTDNNDASTDVIPVPEDPLQQDAYPEVNDLVTRYYTALQAGDTDAIAGMKSNLQDTEKIRIETKCKYIENYQNLVCYTKPGPEANSYIVYVYYDAKLIGIDTLAPGLNPLYVCTDENGKLYIYDGELADNVLTYMEAIAEQEDVVDLNTKVSVLYADALDSDEKLKLLMTSLKDELDTTVGETIATLAATDAAATDTTAAATDATTPATTDTTAATDTTATDTTVAAAVTPVTETVQTTETVNIRSSDSETADKIDKVAAGTQFTRLEARANGWSKILYNNQEAYVKSDYLVTVTAATQGEAAIGTVTVLSTVNIRSTASETASKVGVAYKGEQLNLVEKQSDGWCRINYNGQTAYVKTDFVQ